MTVFVDRLLSRFAHGALLLMLTLPFLLAYHYYPLPSFFSECLAFLFGLMALVFLARPIFAESLEVPKIVLVPLLLMLLAWGQILLMPSVFPGKAAVFSLYMLWAALMCLLGRQLARTLGFDGLACWLASAILLGALLQSLIAILQIQGLGEPWVMQAEAGNVFGNLAQRNNFCNQLWLAIAAAIYLRSRRYVSIGVTVVCLSVFVVLTSLAGSRTIWLYASSFVVFSGLLLWWQGGDGRWRTMLYWSLGVMVGGVAFQWLMTSGLIEGLVQYLARSAGERLLDSGGSDPLRIAYWRIAFSIWKDSPWFGMGIGEFQHQFYLRVLEVMPIRFIAPPEHAHNILFHLLAETGMVGTTLLVFAAAYWITGMRRLEWQRGEWFLVALILVQVLHSGLEYPLWYGFFLGPLAIALGGLATVQCWKLKPGRSLAIGTAVCMLMGAVLLMNIGEHYLVLERYVNGGLLQREDNGVEPGEVDLRERIGGTLFSPYIDLVTVLRLPEKQNSADLVEDIELCERAIRFMPLQRVLFKCARFQMTAGRQKEALLSLERAVASYPEYAENVREQWKLEAGQDVALTLLLRHFPAIVY